MVDGFGIGFSIMDPKDFGSSQATLPIVPSPLGSGQEPGSLKGRVSGYRDQMMFRMYMAVAALCGIFFAAMMGILYFLAAPWWIALLLTLGLITLQWWGSPWIIRRLFKIRWLDTEADARATYGDDIYNYIREQVGLNQVQFPRLGIVDDDNPNAFTFGRTKNSAHLVITRGILKYCDREEAKSVVAHEMGHIVHNDFVVMTLVAAIPLVLYVIWRGFIDSMRYSHGSKKGSEYVLIVIAISYVAWLLSQFIALCVSRFREYYADDFAARSTGDANKLSSALVKIAYGMTKEGDKSKEEVLKDKRIAKDRSNNAMMFQDMGTSRAFAISGLSLSPSGATVIDLQNAREWDERNVWARLFELQMTHPLTSKRIRALSRTAQEQGKAPLVDPEYRFGPMLWGDFGTDVAAKYMAGLGILMTVFFVYTMQWALAVVSATTVVGVLAAIYLALWAYPMGFKHLQVSRIKDQIMDPRAGPVHGKPVKIQGIIVGRGVPGLFFSEDLKLDDGSGIMLLDYHQVSKALDFFIGIFKTQEKVGKKALIEGWYRRAPVPYVEILRMNWVDDKGDNRVDTCYTYPFMMAMVAGLAILGGLFLGVMALGVLPGILLGTALGIAVLCGIAWTFRYALVD